jgi:hypothetical protein
MTVVENKSDTMGIWYGFETAIQLSLFSYSMIVFVDRQATSICLRESILDRYE